MALQVGSAFVKVGADFVDEGFRRFDHAVDRARNIARNDVEAKGRMDVDGAGFRRYENNLDHAERHTHRFRTGVVASMGALRVGVAGAAAAGAASLGLLAKAAISGASDINESITKNRVLFGDHAKDIEQFSKRSADSFGISRKAALEYTGVFGNLFRALGQSREQSAGMSTDLTKLAADMASFNNESIDDTLEAIRSGLVGETEPLRRFGVNINDAQLRQVALDKGLVKTTKETLPAQAKALAAVELITRQTSAAHGDFARTSGGLANQTRILQANLADNAAELGAKLLPAALFVVKGINDLGDAFDGTSKSASPIVKTFVEIRRVAGDVVDGISGFVGSVVDLAKTDPDIQRFGHNFVGIVRDIGAFLQDVGRRISKVFSSDDGIGADLRQLIRGVANVAVFLQDTIYPVVRRVLPGLALAIEGVATVIRGVVRIVAGILTGDWAKAWQGAQDVVGGFAKVIGGVAKAGFGAFIGATRRLLDFLAGAASSILGVIGDLADAASHLPGVGGKFKGVAESVRNAQRDIDHWRESLRDTGREGRRFDLEAVRRENRATGKSFRDLAKDADLTAVRKQVKDNAERIKHDLGKNSADGKAALARNFEDAQQAVRKQMHRGSIATRDGMREIRGYLTQELELYGFNLRQARNIAKTGDPDANRGREGGAFRNQRGGRGRYAVGGWFGGRGMVGDDTIEFAPGQWAAPGEAMLTGGRGDFAITNRHQVPYVEQALAFTKALGLGPYGDLDELFAGQNRPHRYQGGGRGIVPVPGFPGERANASIIGRILGLVRRFSGLVLTDAFGPGHQSPGHTVTGTAADFAGPDPIMDAAVRYLTGLGYLVGYDGRFGSADWPGHGPAAGQGGGNAHFHVEFGSAGAPVVTPRVPRIGVRGGGTVGVVAGRALDLARAGAQSELESVISSALAMPTAGGHGALGGNAARNKALARGLLGRFGWGRGEFPALDTLWAGESGWNEQARNPSSGAAGIPQDITGNMHGGALGQILWGLRYIKGRYGSPSAALRFWQAHSPHWYQSGARGRFNSGEGDARPAIHAKRFRILRRRAIGLGRNYDNLVNSVEGLETNFGLRERRFNLTEEELLNPDGTVNVGARDTRVHELDVLIGLRKHIRDRLRRARNTARHTVNALEHLIGRIGKRNDPRSRRQLRRLRGDRRQWAATLQDAGFDLRDARIDIDELTGERAGVLGTAPDVETPDPVDEPATRPPTAADIAAAVQAEVDRFSGLRSDLFTQFGSNVRPAPAGFFGVSPLTAAAGVQNYGAVPEAAGVLAAAGGGMIAGSGKRVTIGTVVNNFHEPPPDPFGYAHKQLAELEAY